MERFLRGLFATILFAALAYLPWYYWEASRLVMRGEAPAGKMRIGSQSAGEAIWWLMGLGMLLWVPLSLVIAGVASLAFLALTRTKD
ncbi:hypothetical protein J7432_09635 [Xanthomonas axonopodis pv. begoniae]|uniref:Uncharacterized protein orf87 n=1 Tax=Xanthomonas axonopodis pv. begoniae TaxID=473403 RepID=Q5BMT1_9XANT|nr:hypothetical protein [Xanthomonas axonopodis pv. begoniae]MBO9739276.1 hypothetical protein [Xanthomonas axonopodis pv. begoniae]MBO9772945.1 hypothetical protein [Xanthomonas axonopodis pv. begoniae]